MKTSFLAVTLLALSASFANAETYTLSGKVMNDFEALRVGTTAQPTAKVYSDSLADGYVQHRSGFNSGRTANPLASVEDWQLSSKAARDLTGARG